jgi:hypothetical protein
LLTQALAHPPIPGFPLLCQMKPHYTKGGQPGFFPSLKEATDIPHPVPFDLYGANAPWNQSPLARRVT